MLRRSKSDGGSGPARILVVNDDEGGCELVARILEARGATAQRVHTHADAVVALNRTEDPVTLAVLDFTSGGTASSLKLLDSIRHGIEGSRDVPVVMLAASPNNRMFAYQSGTDAFLVRPLHADELGAAIEEVLARSPEEREAYRTTQVDEARTA